MAEIRVRMYNVGFGDCFLLEFPRQDQEPFRVLVDCGSHSAGHPRDGWKISDAVAAIVNDVGEGAAPVIDVVAASHRHQDHVSGFDEPAWSDVNVGEVWLPWTEDPSDPEATRIRTRQSSLALNLTNAFADASFDDRWESVDIKGSLRAMVANSLTNEAAMRTLHQGFSGKPDRRFLSTPETTTIEPTSCSGLTVHVLGPSRDEATIRDMDPPPGQSYLRFGTAPPPGVPVERSPSGEGQGPFAKSFVLDENRYEQSYQTKRLGGALKRKAAGIMRDTDMATAVSLDKAVNGTSLMLMFEFGSAYLPFPGDAQWGTWNAVMSLPATRNLIGRTTFYKVGHHGSHNATPVDFLQKVLDPDHTFWGAAASVRPISFWPDIPRIPLLDELAKRSERVLRSDDPGKSQSGVGIRRRGLGVDFHVPC
jgi:beta-lactamase superfamily II metal-dependent hydrolase